MRRALPTAGGVLLAALLAATCGTSPAAAAVAVVAVVAVLAQGWPVLLALPSPRGSAGVVVAVGVVAAVVVLATGVGGTHPLRGLPVVLAISVLGAFVHQLLRRDLRPRVVDGLSGVVSGMLVAALASGWIATATGRGGPVALLAGTALAAASLGSGAVPARAAASRWLAAPLAAAAAGALAAGPVLPALPGLPDAPWSVPGVGAVLGVVLGLLTALVADLLAGLPAAGRPRAAMAVAAAPPAAAGLVVYAAVRVISSLAG